MISTNPFRKVIPVGILGLTALGLLFCAGEVAAQVTKGGKVHEPQAVSNQQLHNAIGVLRSARVTLEKADHDYGGHRAAAVRDINKAIKQLRLALNQGNKKPGKGTKKGPATGKGPRQPEPQALSDAQLAGTIPVLKKTIKVLQHANHDYGGHRAQAVTDLRAAVHQLETALKFSKTYNKNKL